MSMSTSIATAIRHADRGNAAGLCAMAVYKAPGLGFFTKANGAKANAAGWMSSDPWVVTLM